MSLKKWVSSFTRSAAGSKREARQPSAQPPQGMSHAEVVTEFLKKAAEHGRSYGLEEAFTFQSPISAWMEWVSEKDLLFSVMMEAEQYGLRVIRVDGLIYTFARVDESEARPH